MSTDKFQTYKKIKDRSLFNIIPEKYHQEILDGSILVEAEANRDCCLKKPSEALYIICEGEIALYEKDRKLKIKTKSVTKGRSLELDRVLEQNSESEFDWEIQERVVAFEVPSALLFSLFERDVIFHSYLRKVLSSFELRKLKNDLRLFGFDELEIQKTFYCLEEHPDTISKIDNAICILKNSQVTFYYHFDGNKKILGEYEYGDFFVWSKNRKLNYEVSDGFICWKLEVSKWQEYVDKEKIENFVYLVDPFKGKIHSSMGVNSKSSHEEVLVLQPESIESFCSEEYVDFQEVFLKDLDKDRSGLIASLALLKSFKIKIDIEYLTSLLPIGVGGSSLYDMKKIFERLGFITHITKLDPKNIKQVKWPFIIKYQGRHVVCYECIGDKLTVMDPLVGESELTIDELEQSSSMMGMLVKASDLEEKKEFKSNIWLGYIQVILESKLHLFFVLLSSILIFLLNLTLPVVTQIIFDEVLVTHDLDMLRLISVGAIAILIVSSLLVFIRSYLLTHLTTVIDAKFSATFFDRLLNLHRKFYEKFSSGDIISRLNELKKIRKFFTAKTFKLMVDLFSAALFMILLGLYNIKLLVCVLVLLPLVFIYIKILTPKIVETLNNMYRYGASAQSRLIEQFGSIETIKSYNMQYTSRLKWQGHFNNVLKERKRFELLNSLIGVGSDFFLQFIPLVVVVFAIYLHLENELSLGQVIASTTIVGFIIYPIINLMKFMDDYKQMSVSFNRVNEVVFSALEKDAEQTNHLDEDLKSIKISKATYKYGDEVSPYVLKNVSLNLEVGKDYAIVGSSGAGKSTLAHLLLGADRMLSGDIFYNENNLRTLDIEELRKNIVYIGAEAQTYSGTIVENISLSSDISSLEAVIESAKIADAHNFISSLPDGYMTKLGEGGEGLSLGQKQKICIARSLYNRPKILLLDEATSILDSASERNIFQNLKDNMIGRTLIIITHRLDILGQVNEVFVMHKGEVVESGKHDDLILNQGRYYEMWKDINF